MTDGVRAMGRVDLDAVQAAYDASKPALSTHPKDCTNNCYDGPCDCSGEWQVKGWTFDPASVPALVAELRVARKLIDRVQRGPIFMVAGKPRRPGTGCGCHGCIATRDAFWAYDQHTATQDPGP
jgi:hypothetical protein